MSRALAFKTGREKTCSAKARQAEETRRRRRQEKAERMRLVRQAAPSAPNLQRRLRIGLPPRELAAACARLFRAFPHLRPAKDGASVKEYVLLSRILDAAWSWIATIGTLAKASASGRIHWSLSGLEPLVRLSDRRLRLGEALLLSPKSQSEAAMPGANAPRPGQTVVILAGDHANYVARLRALRAPDAKARPALPLPAAPAAPSVAPLLGEAPAQAVERLLASLEGAPPGPGGAEEESPEGE